MNEVFDAFYDLLLSNWVCFELLISIHNYICLVVGLTAPPLVHAMQFLQIP